MNSWACGNLAAQPRCSTLRGFEHAISDCCELTYRATMRVATHQPNLFPRLKVLQKLASADVWIVLDNVQYCPREWQNRARIVVAHGSSSSFWLTTPVSRSKGRDTLIQDVAVVDPA